MDQGLENSSRRLCLPVKRCNKGFHIYYAIVRHSGLHYHPLVWIVYPLTIPPATILIELPSASQFMGYISKPSTLAITSIRAIIRDPLDASQITQHKTCVFHSSLLLLRQYLCLSVYAQINSGLAAWLTRPPMYAAEALLANWVMEMTGYACNTLLIDLEYSVSMFTTLIYMLTITARISRLPPANSRT